MRRELISKRVLLNVLAGAVMLAFITACGRSNGKMTLTVKPQNGTKVEIVLIGSGTATIDWGDGSPKETCFLNGKGDTCRWEYSRAFIHSQKVIEKNITE